MEETQGNVMELEIKLFASLRKFNPELERIEVDDGITILELFDKVGIPPSEVAIVLVNGRHAKLDQPLHDGETVAAFPPIAGG
ncbi:MAG: MoaD/ThiS family protein [Syntrophobacteria bacterium]